MPSQAFKSTQTGITPIQALLNSLPSPIIANRHSAPDVNEDVPQGAQPKLEDEVADLLQRIELTSSPSSEIIEHFQQGVAHLEKRSADEAASRQVSGETQVTNASTHNTGHTAHSNDTVQTTPPRPAVINPLPKETYIAAMTELMHEAQIADVAHGSLLPFSTTSWGVRGFTRDSANDQPPASLPSPEGGVLIGDSKALLCDGDLVNDDMMQIVGGEYVSLLTKYQRLVIGQGRDKCQTHGGHYSVPDCLDGQASCSNDLRAQMKALDRRGMLNWDPPKDVVLKAEGKAANALARLWRIWYRLAVLEREKEEVMQKMGLK